jgi:hypothetical protein
VTSKRRNDAKLRVYADAGSRPPNLLPSGMTCTISFGWEAG